MYDIVFIAVQYVHLVLTACVARYILHLGVVLPFSVVFVSVCECIYSAAAVLV